MKEVHSGILKNSVALKYSIPACTMSILFQKKKTIISAVENGYKCCSSKRLENPMDATINEAVLDWF